MPWVAAGHPLGARRTTFPLRPSFALLAPGRYQLLSLLLHGCLGAEATYAVSKVPFVYLERYYPMELFY
eukprot:scaffold303808_cov23-Prasinocladus_malaysianus.AAC.1